MDKKTKDALVALVKALMNDDEDGREADKYREDNDRLYCENSGLRDELRKLKEKYDSVSEDYEYVLALQTEYENKIVEMELAVEKLQEQADIDKMQIALYDKENKELRRKFAMLKDIVGKACGEAFLVYEVPVGNVYAEDDAEKKREAWKWFMKHNDVCCCQEVKPVED